VVVGLVFDFLLWKDIFVGKFGEDIWAERAERASAIIMSFSYAFVCAQLGAAYAVKMLVKKRKYKQNATEKETEVYNKSTAKDTLGINLVLFSLLTVLATGARFSQEELDFSDKFILSLAATTIGLVISAVAYWYTDVYDHFIKAAKNRESIARKNFIKVSKKIGQNYER
jgi:SNF family Na+-dependent transporter